MCRWAVCSVYPRHPFGCRVLERLLEHCGTAQSDVLLDELLCLGSEANRTAFFRIQEQAFPEALTALGSPRRF